MSTPVQICNSALIKIGVDSLIQDLSENTKEARLCNEQYTKLRDSVLENHYWNFAMKRADLSAVSGGTAVYGWTYKYALPTDCLRVKELEYQNAPFVVEGGYLYSNEATAKVLYISRVTDTSKFTPIFREVLALAIASDLAYPLVQSVSLSERIEKKYLRKLADARSLDAQEGYNNPMMQDLWLDSRRGGVSSGNHPSSLTYSGDGKVVP